MVGKYFSPSEIKKSEAGKTVLQALQCPKCSAPISIRAPGITTTLACSSCDSVLDVSVSPDQTNTALVLAQESENTKAYKPILPLGVRGKFHGETWEVIGFMVRSSQSFQKDDDQSWHEYLLFNPYKGYRWLTQDAGHWNYFVPLHEQPKKDALRTTWQGHPIYDYSGLAYHYNDKNVALVKYVSGEFYWKIRYNDVAQISEFTHAPFVLTQEQQGQEINWSFGEDTPVHKILEAFKGTDEFAEIAKAMPAVEGVASNQPFPAQKFEKTVYKMAGFFSAALLAVYFVTATLFPTQTVYEADAVVLPKPDYPSLLKRPQFFSLSH